MLCVDSLDRGQEEVVLGGEVVADRLERHPGIAGDPANRHLVVPTLRERLDGGIDDSLAGRLGGGRSG